MEWKNKILEQMYIQTNVQITWEGSTYGNIERNNVKIQNKNLAREDTRLPFPLKELVVTK